MILSLEMKKLKRTGIFPAFLIGALLVGAFPIVNMLARAETFTSLPGEPLTILAEANWQMMSMINLLVLLCGACMMYHTEFADNGFQKMEMLPLSSAGLFFGKLVILLLLLALMLLTETASLAFCAGHWFPGSVFSLREYALSAGFWFIATLPTVILTLLIASAFPNMWISLGIGVILLFTVSVFPQDNPVLILFPFSTPYQILALARENGTVASLLTACAAEILALSGAELLYQKIRRCFA